MKRKTNLKDSFSSILQLLGLNKCVILSLKLFLDALLIDFPLNVRLFVHEYSTICLGFVACNIMAECRMCCIPVGAECEYFGLSPLQSAETGALQASAGAREKSFQCLY